MAQPDPGVGSEARAILRNRLDGVIQLLDSGKDQEAAPALFMARWMNGVKTEGIADSVLEEARARSFAAHDAIRTGPPNLDRAKGEKEAARRLFGGPAGEADV